MWIFLEYIIGEFFEIDMTFGSDLNCKMTKFIYYIFESAKQWLMVSFTFYILISIISPMKGKALMDKATMMIILGVYCFSALASIPTLFAWKISKSPEGEMKCSALGASSVLSFMLAFFTTAQKYAISTTVDLILTIWLAYRLVMFSKKRQRMLSKTITSRNSYENLDKKTFNSAISNLCMTSVHAAIYIAESLSWGTLYMDNFAKILSPGIYLRLFRIGKIADTASVIPRMWNFYVYFIRLPVFRYEIVKVYSCGRVHLQVRDMRTTRTYKVSGSSK